MCVTINGSEETKRDFDIRGLYVYFQTQFLNGYKMPLSQGQTNVLHPFVVLEDSPVFLITTLLEIIESS